MTDLDHAALERALDALPLRFPGPGGVAGIVYQGRVIATRIWGHANLDQASPMTAATRLPICSISKQFTCAAFLGALGAPEEYDARVSDYLPRFSGALPTVRDLANNQSGLRDYWAMTVLHGARAEQTFAKSDGLKVIGQMQSGHFAPGLSYSYCNANFRILSEILESETGRSLGELYQSLIFAPADMATAALTPDTRHPVDGVTGYEGNAERGFIPADNGIWWAGDAGISASLNDMLAYEQWIDATREDAESLYRRISVSQDFRDGQPAPYGFGLRHERIGPWAATGHGGALRGFRLNRIHVARARLSAVVLFNHEADAHTATLGLLRAALGVERPAPGIIADAWEGAWLCPETSLSVRITPERAGGHMAFATSPELLRNLGNGSIGNDGCTLTKTADGITMIRPGEALESRLLPLSDNATAEDITGTYASDETGSEMRIERTGPAYSVTFCGMLGTGQPEPLAPLSRDVWLLATRRSMDAPAPGEWTLRLIRDAAGRIIGATLGCWLARHVAWRRL